MDEREEVRRKNEGWKKDGMTRKTKIENITRQEGIKEGKDIKKSMFGFYSFLYSFVIEEGKE